MPSLAGAHKGYLHQDVVTAIKLAALLLPRSSDTAVVADRKVTADDRFDDLGVVGATRRRIQLKSHVTEHRSLRALDLSTNVIEFRLDRAVRSFIDDPEPADEYRLSVTYAAPDDTLAPLLERADSAESLVPGVSTQRFRISVEAVWPLDGEPAWQCLDSLPRDAVVRFLDRFIVETGVPQSSRDLRNPGPLDDALMRFLYDRIGVGRPPNDHRDLASDAAHLIFLAQQLRSDAASGAASDVITALALQVDYGRVEEHLPLDPARLVQRGSELDLLVAEIAGGGTVLVTGSPGAGKSWLLHELRDRLRAEGWVVALHYCFIDLLDQARERRTTIATMFGSIIAELLDADPDLVSETVARYAAGPVELEAMLAAASESSPTRRIAVIVDGVDHADRVLGHGAQGAAVDIAQELSALELPGQVTLVVGSQPGSHLSALEPKALVHEVSSWNTDDLTRLAHVYGLTDLISTHRLDLAGVLEVISDRSRGNPLYATYLSRTATQLLRGEWTLASDADLLSVLAGAPPFDADLDTYYDWLMQTVRADVGAVFIAQVLSMLDFAVTASELREIHPPFAHLVDSVLSQLMPILAEDPAMGGLRVYHESFQRFVRERINASGGEIAPIVAPVIDWLHARGFFDDKRAFRSLLGLLQLSGRHDEVVSVVDVDFVARAAAYGQPGDAVLLNLSTAASSAVAIRSWSDLARLVEVARAADYLYHWRLDDDSMAEEYGRGYAALFGAQALADRLIHDGRCTFRPRPGLVLCRLCEEERVVAPWQEYRAAHDRQRKTDRTVYSGGDAAISYARLMGRLRLAGRERAIQLVAVWLNTPDNLPNHPIDVALVLGTLYDADAVDSVVDQSDPGVGRAWAYLAAARLAEDALVASTHATNAIRDGLPVDGIAEALSLGGRLDALPVQTSDLETLTAHVVTREVRLSDDLMTRWIAALEFASATGDDAALVGAQLRIVSDSWYHRWLRFAVTLHRDVPIDDLLGDLEALGDDVQPFRGDPRVVDLYPVHSAIQRTFLELLQRVDDGQWSRAAEALSRISTETSSWLQGSRSGPLPLDEFFGLLLMTSSTSVRATTAARLGSELLGPETRTGEFYDTHAGDQILLSRILLHAGDREAAKAAWTEACRYLASYGWRKDITVFEVLDSLPIVQTTAPDLVSDAIARLQPIVEGVLVHTDGKETRHAIHSWIDAAARIDPAGVLRHLARDSLARTPSFGVLDHAFPLALGALSGVLDEDALAFGWVSCGGEVVGASDDALRAAERQPDPAWAVVVAALAGDNAVPASGTAASVTLSAARLGRASPEISEVVPEDPHSSNAHRATDSSRPSSPVEFEFPTDASILQVAHLVRRWRDQPEGASSVASVAASVADYLRRLVESSLTEDAETLLSRIARDTPLWARDGLLSTVAAELTKSGPDRLAAIANTFAYTRARDGWRRFAGPAGEELFVRAVAQDREAATSTLFKEVADCVATGGENGVNAHLFELLARSGEAPQAYAAWSEACRAILYRVPAVGRVDDIATTYESTPADPLISLVSAAIARLNHVLVNERRAALGGIALLIERGGPALGHAMTQVALDLPPSVLIPVLALWEAHEPSPYEATMSGAEVLNAFATGELVSARVMARRILNRAGVEVGTSIPPALTPDSAPADEDLVEAASYVGRARLAPIEAIWPGFTRHVLSRFGAALHSESMRERMKSAYRRIRSDRTGRETELWLPLDEELEAILQRVGASARANLAMTGVIEPYVEDRVGDLLLGNAEITARASLSRIARPGPIDGLPQIDLGGASRRDAVYDGPMVVPKGEFEGWIVVGHHETTAEIGDSYDLPVVARVESWSSLVYADGDYDLGDDLPVGRGDFEVWLHDVEMSVGPFGGPMLGLDILRDAWGVVELLTPHPILAAASHLTPGPLRLGLALTDGTGAPALVSRIWRESLIGDDDLADHEHRRKGSVVLARPDVLSAIAPSASGRLLHLQSVLRRTQQVSATSTST